MMDRQQVNLRLDRELIDQLDDLARGEHVDRTEITRRILVSGIAEARVDHALRDYAAGRVTAWRAANDAGVSLYQILDRIHERGIPYELDPGVLERLGESAPRKEAVRASESRGSYGAPSDVTGGSDETSGIEALRARYKPKTITTLFVGESSPAQGTHFYRANSNLFRATRSAFAAALGNDVVPNGEAFLRFFADQEAWLVDLADKPVNQLSDPDRRTAVEAGIPGLVRTIRAERPKQIVVVKRDIVDAVSRAVEAAGSDAAVLAVPFPVRQWRVVFERDLAQFLVADLGAQRRMG